MKGLFFKTEKYTVAVVFDGRSRHVKNVTRYATCRDVMHKLLTELRITTKTDEFKMYEVANSSQRVVHDKEKLVKVMRSWGVDRHRFEFVMRRHCTKVSFFNPAYPASGPVDELDTTVAGSSGGFPAQIPINDCQKQVTAYLNQRNLIQSGNDNHKLGKLSVLRRFFTDLPFQQTPTFNHIPNGPSASARVVGDRDETRHEGDTCMDNTRNVSIGANVTARAPIGEYDTRNEQDELLKLDVAFIELNKDEFSDEGIDSDSDISTSEELDTAFIGDSDEGFGHCFASDDDAPDMHRSSDLTNVSRDDYVRKLFDFQSGGERRLSKLSHDAELESFMNTRLYETDVDEGVSSSGSNAIMVAGKETSV